MYDISFSTLRNHSLNKKHKIFYFMTERKKKIWMIDHRSEEEKKQKTNRNTHPQTHLTIFFRYIDKIAYMLQ